ncbi:MAG: PBP1A family penicillin-binding protein [Candidatus Pacebacteria bacterium]|nr:PBP1A family penicillin-binding protein [Candidatus Paceibacterota bacterium]
MPVRKKYRKQVLITKRKKATQLKKFNLKLPKLSFRKKKVVRNLYSKNENSRKRLIKKSVAPSLFKKTGRLFFGGGKKNKKKLKRTFKAVFRLTAILFVVGLTAVVGIFIYFSKDIPDPNKIIDRSVAQSTKIYDRTGEHLLYEIHGEEKRTIIKLDDVSQHLINATISSEDQQFYDHYGIDFKGIARAIYKDIIAGEKAQGASTITQQLIKNSILTSEKTFTRKIKEIILAIETEQKFSKDEILEMYLNQIPYGSNAYGIEAAAKTFFGKSAKDLDISEAALLAGLPKATTYYSPYGAHPEALEFRYKNIINQMLQEGYISEDEAKGAKEVEILKKIKPFQENITAPHFVMFVKQQLVDEFGEEKVEKGGLKVYTTLFYEMQMIAEDAVKKGAAENVKNYDAHNAALVAIDPKTGKILAMVGSKDYFDIEEDGNVNVAISPHRQPGSSFKPFVYATAFKKGYTPDTILFDTYTNFGKDGSGKEFRPHNYNFKYSGPVTIKNALARSLNIPAVKTLYLAGIEDSVETARDLGITTLNNPDTYGLSLVLGTGEVRLLDMVSAYGVFANEGNKNNYASILKIEDYKGEVLKEFKENSKQVLDVEVARNITSILSDNVARTPAFGSKSDLYLGERPVAAKTGTTNSFKDGWTIGYTPSLAAGVWAGNNNATEMKRAGGIKAAAPIWNDFMTRVLALDPIEKFVSPELIETDKPILNGKYKNEVVVKLDKACGDKLANELTPDDQIEEKIYLTAHNILYYVDKNNPQGDYPKNPAEDEQFAYWEGPVIEWLKENADEINMEPPTEVCNLRNADSLPILEIVSPQNNQIIKGDKLKVKAEALAEFDIDQIDFYFDDVLIGIGKVSPYEVYYKIPAGTAEGSHQIIIRAYDQIGSSVERKISVIISANQFLHLQPIIGNDFPYVLNAIKSDDAVESISFYYQLDSVFDADLNLIKKPGPKYEIKKATFPVPDEENLYQVLWEEDKTYFISGKYEIFAVSESKNGKLHRSNGRFVEVK